MKCRFSQALLINQFKALSVLDLSVFLTSVFKRIYWFFADFFCTKKDKYFGWAHRKIFYF